MATNPKQAPLYMVQALLGFNEQLERMGEVTVVVLLGIMLSTYALQHGVEGNLARSLIGITLSVVAASIIVHGISVTPLMSLYSKVSARRLSLSQR